MYRRKINEILITTKESLITNFIQNILIILIPSISVLISIFLIESNTNFIDEIDDTNEQIIDDFSSIDKTINNKF